MLRTLPLLHPKQQRELLYHLHWHIPRASAFLLTEEEIASAKKLTPTLANLMVARWENLSVSEITELKQQVGAAWLKSPKDFKKRKSGYAQFLRERRECCKHVAKLWQILSAEAKTDYTNKAEPSFLLHQYGCLKQGFQRRKVPSKRLWTSDERAVNPFIFYLHEKQIPVSKIRTSVRKYQELMGDKTTRKRFLDRAVAWWRSRQEEQARSQGKLSPYAHKLLSQNHRQGMPVFCYYHRHLMRKGIKFTLKNVPLPPGMRSSGKLSGFELFQQCYGHSHITAERWRMLSKHEKKLWRQRGRFRFRKHLIRGSLRGHLLPGEKNSLPFSKLYDKENMFVTHRMRAVARLWNSLSPVTKKKYAELAKHHKYTVAERQMEWLRFRLKKKQCVRHLKPSWRRFVLRRKFLGLPIERWQWLEH